jgi:hypothetical protein
MYCLALSSRWAGAACRLWLEGGREGREACGLRWGDMFYLGGSGERTEWRILWMDALDRWRGKNLCLISFIMVWLSSAPNLCYLLMLRMIIFFQNDYTHKSSTLTLL